MIDRKNDLLPLCVSQRKTHVRRESYDYFHYGSSALLILSLVIHSKPISEPISLLALLPMVVILASILCTIMLVEITLSLVPGILTGGWVARKMKGLYRTALLQGLHETYRAGKLFSGKTVELSSGERI